MSRRTSSEFDLNQFKRKASMHTQSVKVSMSTRDMTNTHVVENQIQLTEKSSSFKTACSLILNRLPIKKPVQEMTRTPKDFLKIQDRADFLQDLNPPSVLESSIIPHASALTFSYTSVSSPAASNEIIVPEKLMQRKRDPMEIEGQLRQIQNADKMPLRVVIMNFLLCPNDSRVQLVKYYSYFAKRHILFSELLIALAFGLPYSFLDRNDLLVLLIINCHLIYTIAQMKKRYANRFHTTWSVLTMLIHQTMLIFLNNAFALDESNVSTSLLLIFASSSLVGITSLPTIITVLYCLVLKTVLFYFSGQFFDISQLAMPIFITVFSSIIALVTSLRNVNSSYFNGIKMIKMKNMINKAELDVDKLDAIAASLLPDYVWRELKEGRHGAFTGNINKGLRYEYPKASIIFADVVGFTVLSSKIDKDELLKILNHIFTRFDKIAELHDMEKVKTVGDCYVAVGGITTNSEDCAARCALMGLKMVEAMKEIQKSEIIPNGIVVALRIGAHVGSATGGLIGETKMIFDIWSKDVSIAGQMEQCGMANRLHISQPFLDDIKSFAVVEAGPGIVFQDKKIQTYFLKSISVNASFLKGEFIKKLCTMGKQKIKKPMLEKPNYTESLKSGQHSIHSIQMVFNEVQLEVEYTRKSQKNCLLMNISSIILNLVLALCFGFLALLNTKFHLAIIIVLSMVVGLHIIIVFVFFSAYFKNLVVFEALSYFGKQFFKLGSVVQSYDFDQVFLFLMIQIYSLLMAYGFIKAYDLESVHNSFYICTLSGFIFQNIKFVYFVSYFILVLATYIYCVSISNLTLSAYLLVIFYLVCTAICVLNNYTCNYMRRHFYRSEIINKDRMYTLQDQLFKTNKTVLKLLPPHVTEMLKSGQVEFSESFPQCAVIFCEIIGVSNYASNPDLLNEIISRIDKSLCLYPGVDKVKTIYSVYMAASGITPESRTIENHIEAALDFANSLKKQLLSLKNTGYNLSLKVGISVGPVIGGIVGKSKLTYDIWGDTVNTASRMESTADLQTIQTTQSVFHLFKDKYKFEDRGPIHIKGKGIMNTFLLGSKKKLKRAE